MFVLRSAAIVLMLVTVVAGTVAGGGVTLPPPPPPPPPPPVSMPPPLPPALEITEFIAVAGYGNIYTFEGQVTGGDGSAVTIYFGDSPTMTGQTCTVQEDGSFTFTIRLTADDYGPISAEAIDESGDISELDYVYVLAD